jgi:gamma-glutamyl:cysteine ligase YbdK (ATP-grasp superfamily)
VHPDEERVVEASELAAQLLERLEPVAQRLGAAEELRALDPASCEADRQLAVGREHGLDALCADLVERSLASPT